MSSPPLPKPGRADGRAAVRCRHMPAGAQRIPDLLNAGIMLPHFAAIFLCFRAASVASSPWTIAALASGPRQATGRVENRFAGRVIR